MNGIRAIPTSRAYWGLKADQVLNRVFEQTQPIEVEVCDTSPALTAAPSPQVHQISRINRLEPNPWLLPTAASLILMVLAGMAVLLLGAWNSSQQAIREERNLLLLERLRSLGPGNPAAPADPAPSQAKATGDAGELPPPPPGEPWMEELASLPASTAPKAAVLRVPLNDRIANPAPAAGGASTPELVGVVQVPGQGGSAIFQIGASSTSAAVGESIGSTGWRLRSASGDSVILEKGGEQRRVSISSGF
jgi:hypothetical protein